MQQGPVEDAVAIFSAAVKGVQADTLLDSIDWDQPAGRPPDSYGRCFVVGMGKASLAMASVVEAKLQDRITAGCIVVPRGYRRSLPSRFALPSRIRVIDGGHPIPDDGSRRAAKDILKIASGANADDLLIVLISGGGSSLCADFVGGISLQDAKATYGLLLESGADIHALNTVRKHLSTVGGGRLAEAAYPANVLSLIISDVVGDDLSVIAGGPTTGDPTSYADARAILDDFRLWDQVPTSVRSVIESGIQERERETPKPNGAIFQNVTNRLIGTNAEALDAARHEAVRRGYAAEIVTRTIRGEAREVGRSLCRSFKTAAPRECLLYGGETTVTVRGSGRGGRNQEAALAAALELSSSPDELIFLSGGTDGVDGPTDAAGAWATNRSYSEGLARGFDAEDFLQRNDSHAYFKEVGGLLETGSTHTNVGDVLLLLRPG